MTEKSLFFIYPVGKVVLKHKSPLMVPFELKIRLRGNNHYKNVTGTYNFLRVGDEFMQKALEFPDFDPINPHKHYLEEYNDMLNDAHKTVQHPKFKLYNPFTYRKTRIFVINFSQWPVTFGEEDTEFGHFYFIAQTINELKYKVLMHNSDLGEKDNQDLLKYVSLVKINVPGSNNECDNLPHIKHILESPPEENYFITNCGALKVSDVPITAIKQVAEQNGLEFFVLEYDNLKKRIIKGTIDDTLLSKCKGTPIAKFPNQTLVAVCDPYLVPRVDPKYKKITHGVVYFLYEEDKLDESEMRKNLHNYIEVKQKRLLILNHTIGEGDNEIKIIELIPKPGHWKTDFDFYLMVSSLVIALYTVATDATSLYHYYTTANETLYGILFSICLFLNFSGRHVVHHLKGNMKWYTTILIIFHLDRVKELYTRWRKQGDKPVDLINVEIINLYTQTIPALCISAYVQLSDGYITTILILSTAGQFVSLAYTFVTNMSIFQGIPGSKLKGASYEKYITTGWDYKISQLIQFVVEIIARFLVVLLALKFYPLVTGLYMYVICAGGIFLFARRYFGYRMEFVIFATLVFPFTFSFGAKDISFIPQNQIRKLVDDQRFELEYVEADFKLYTIIRSVRTLPHQVCTALTIAGYLNYSNPSMLITVAFYMAVISMGIIVFIYIWDILFLWYIVKRWRSKEKHELKMIRVHDEMKVLVGAKINIADVKPSNVVQNQPTEVAASAQDQNNKVINL